MEFNDDKIQSMLNTIDCNATIINDLEISMLISPIINQTNRTISCEKCPYVRPVYLIKFNFVNTL